MQVRCPHCHNPVEILDDSSLRDIACSSCGSSFGLMLDDTISHNQDGTRVGHFELIERLGVGAFGAVWKAKDTKLDRMVAVKIPRKDQLSEKDSEQFFREARAAAQLKHPRIVGVHEVGRDGDKLFIVSDFIQGLTLSDWLTGNQPPVHMAVDIVAKVADALHVAHGKGIVHRDLKTSNIMLDSENEPYVLDFGLAKREAGEITMTIEGQILGTPAYMAPEQARGEAHKADRRADVYALGVILFELLTGERPFRGNARMLLHQVLNEEAANPRQLNSNVPRDIATITLRCLEKKPDSRFQTAQELAADLRRFLAGEPVQSRPITGLERSWRWCRRRPLVSGLSALSVLLLLLGSSLSTAFAFRASREAERAEQNATRARTLATEATDFAEAASRAKDLADQNAAKEQAQRKLAFIAKERAEKELQRAEWLVYAANLSGAQREWESGDVEAALNFLDACRWDFRGWEHDFLFSKFTSNSIRTHPAPGDFQSFAISPDEKTIAISSAGITFRNLQTGEELGRLDYRGGVYDLAFSPDGHRLAVAARKFAGTNNNTPEVTVWNVGNFGRELTLGGLSGAPKSVHYTKDGKYIISAGDGSFPLPDGNGYASAGEIRVWETSKGKEVFTKQPSGGIYDSTLTLDHSRLFTAKFHELQEWNLDNGEFVRTFDLTGLMWESVCLSPDGKTLACGGGTLEPGIGRIVLIDVESGKKKRTIVGHNGRVQALAFSSDNQRIVSGGQDGDVRIWDVDTGREDATLREHLGGVRQVQFARNDSVIISCSSDGTVKVWENPIGRESSVLVRDKGVRRVAVTSDGRLVTADSQQVKVRDSENAEETKISGAGRVQCIAISPGGHWIVGGGGEVGRHGDIQIWELSTGKLSRKFSGHQSLVKDIAFSPEGDHFASASLDRTVKIWRTDSGDSVKTLEGHSMPVQSVAFSRDGSRIATGAGGSRSEPGSFTDAEYQGEVKVWSSSDATEVVSVNTSPLFVNSVQLSLDGKYVAAGGTTGGYGPGVVQVWEVASGKKVREFTELEKSVSEICFSADGQQIAAASRDGTIHIWNFENCEVVAKLQTGTGTANHMCIGADGDLLVAGGNGQIKAWETRTWGEVWSIDASFDCFASNKAATRVATGDLAGNAKLINIADRTQRSMMLAGPTNVNVIEISPMSGEILSAEPSGEIIVWDASSGNRVRSLEGHTLPVIDMDFSPDGKRLVSCATNRSSFPGSTEQGAAEIKLWDWSAGKEIQALSVDSKAIPNCVAFSPDGELIAVGFTGQTFGKPGPIVIWNGITGERVSELPGHPGAVNSVAFGPNSRILASGGKDGRLFFWSLETGLELSEIVGHTGSINIVRLNQAGNRIVTASDDGTLRVWSVQTGQQLLTLDGHHGRVYGFAFAKSGELISVGQDGTVRAWRANKRKNVRKLENAFAFSIAISPDGKRIVTGTTDLKVQVRSMRTGRTELTLPAGPTRSVSYSKDGNRIITGGESTIVWDAQSGGELLKIESGQVLCVAISDDGKTIATGGKQVQLWDAKTGNLLRELAGNQFQAWSLCFNREGSELLAGCGGGKDGQSEMLIWNTESGDETRRLDGHELVRWATFNQDGSRILAGGKTVGLWDAVTGEKLLQVQSEGLNGVAFSADGQRFVGGNKIWETSTGKELQELGNELRQVGRPLMIITAAFTPDGKEVAFSDYYGGVYLESLEIRQ